jgi:DNA topoisomerase-1
MTVGAIVSGAYIGDKMSPVSDSTNITASVCEVPLFDHILSMLWTTVPAFVAAGIVYTVLGFSFAQEQTASLESLNAILSGLEGHFSLDFVAFIPPILMIALAYKRFPVLPVMVACLLSAVAIAVYEGVAFNDLAKMMTSGYVSKTGIKQLDPLLSRGGLLSIMPTVLLLCSGMAFGGILERSRVLEVLLDAVLKAGDGQFTARYYGTTAGKAELHSEAETDAVIAAVTGREFSIDSVKRGKKQRSPSPPFITSTLQQEASRRLGMTPRRTMSIAQQLYEGVDVSGMGTVGLITYMRTDSLRLSNEAVNAARDFIRAHYGEAYCPEQPRRYKTKAGAQDAHEAIRPTNAALAPELVRKDLTKEQYMLYRLIWGRFMACQMANAVYDNVVVDAACAGHVFRANYSELVFPGYTAVYEDEHEDETDAPKKPLPNLKEGDSASLVKLTKEQKFTQPPSRYTEATLIRAMEEKGIGRPSTYAPTITTILSHEYVVKEGKYLRPTALGEVVTGLMEERFPDIVDLKFTARMEDGLDDIEKGEKGWKQYLADFYGGFEQELHAAEAAMEGQRIKVPDEVSEEVCPVCGKNLVVKSGRFGRFLACPGFPDCNFTMPIVVEMPGKCPACGGRLLKRTSRNGYTYYACEKGRDCPWRGQGADGKEIIGFMTWDVPTKEVCPECGKTMFKRSGKGRSKPFCINEACPNFLPEDKRGYKKKAESKPAAEGETQAAGEASPAKKPAAKKPAAKKTAAKKPAAKKPAAKKSAAKKSTTKKTEAAE